jgi:2-polyprenyl-6-methoxyphenol hydroxylase-like FAD-dependent oxidoreductase
MSGLVGHRAVVVEAGIGGLSMAGALAKYFERVEIFERDRLTASAASRCGTPQIGTRMVCWPVALRRSVRFSLASRGISPEPALSL